MPSKYSRGKNSSEKRNVASTQDFDELKKNVVEAQAQALPDQKETFRHESSRHKRGAHNLPDFKIFPLGYSPTKKYYGLYPELFLPAFHPQGDLGTISFGSSELSPNEVYLGDNLQVLRTLPSKSIDLIYIDPPFFSGRNYNLIWGDDNELRTFGDIWEDGLPSYLEWLNARLWEMARVLKDTGSIYVHCDWHASHYIKTEMDKIFGYENFRRDVIWTMSAAAGYKGMVNNFVRGHDTIFYYSKTDNFLFNKVYLDYNEKQLARFSQVDADGRHYKTITKERRLYLDKAKGVPLTDVWSDIANFQTVVNSKELIGYPTQKPEALLERIIRASSNEGDVVADFFMGGGTTCAVAQKLGRRFIGADVSNVAFDVTKSRLTRDGEELSGVKSNISEGGFQGKIVGKKIPDIHLKYVGLYPADLFEDIEPGVFKRHILTILRARPSGTDDSISGYGGSNEPIFIGNSDVKNPIEPLQLKDFIASVNTKYKANTPVKARVFAWHFPAAIERYTEELREKISTMVRPAPLTIELIPIDSELFRQHVLTLYADAQDPALLLAFLHPPIIGELVATKVSGRHWRFEAKGARAVNSGIRLVNCQWDFDYREGHFSAQRGAILSRDKDRDSWKAILAIEHEFEDFGEKIVACKIQDSAGGECIESVKVNV